MDDLYAIVGIDSTAAEEEIEQQIKEQLRLWNKRVNSPDMNKRQEAERKVGLLDKARETLLDEEKRAVFDRELASHGRSEPHSGTPASPGVDWLERARSALSMNDYETAAYAGKQARDSQGATEAVWTLLYRANLGLGNLGEALYEAKQVLGYSPDDPELHLDVGFIQENLGHMDEAIRSYEQAAAHSSHRDQGNMGKASVLMEQSRFDESIPILESLYESNSPKLDRDVTADYLASALLDSAQAVPSYRSKDEYVVTSADEIAVMVPKVRRALEIARNPRLLDMARDNDHYLQRMQQKRFFPGFPIGAVFKAFFAAAVAAVCSGVTGMDVIAVFAVVACIGYVWYKIASRRKYHWEINAFSRYMEEQGR